MLHVVEVIFLFLAKNGGKSECVGMGLAKCISSGSCNGYRGGVNSVRAKRPWLKRGWIKKRAHGVREMFSCFSPFFLCASLSLFRLVVEGSCFFT